MQAAAPCMYYVMATLLKCASADSKAASADIARDADSRTRWMEKVRLRMVANHIHGLRCSSNQHQCPWNLPRTVDLHMVFSFSIPLSHNLQIPDALPDSSYFYQAKFRSGLKLG